MELMDKMRGMRVNIACLQETKEKEQKLKKLMDIIISIIVDKNVKDKGVDIKRVGIRLLLIKLMLEEEITIVINAYVP
ncbi:hypothetical protein AMTRI_Chr13g92090 [Amborella trichopoda]